VLDLKGKMLFQDASHVTQLFFHDTQGSNGPHRTPWGKKGEAGEEMGSTLQEGGKAKEKM